MVNKLGYNFIGGSNQNPFSQGVSCRFMLSNLVDYRCIASKGVVYIQNSGDSATFAIYDDDGSGLTPANLLAYSGVQSLTGTGWYNFTDLIEFVPGGLDIIPGVKYHLAVWVDNPSGHSLNIDPTGLTKQFTELSQAGATFPNWEPHVNPSSQQDFNLSIYLECYTSDSVLGYPSIGTAYTGTYSAPAQLGCLFKAYKSSLFDNIKVRMKTTTTPGRINVALYDDNVGAPKNLLCKSGGSYGTVSTTENWYSCPLRGHVVEGSSYWLVVSCNQNFIMNYDIGTANQTLDDYTTYATFGDAYNTTPDNYYNAIMSFYLQNSSLTNVSGYQLVSFNGRVTNHTGVINNLNKPELISLVANGTSNTFYLPEGTASCVYTAVSTNDTSYNAINIILPTLNSSVDIVGIKKLSGTFSPVIISATAFSATMDGQSTITLYDQYEEITLATDGTNWFII